MEPENSIKKRIAEDRKDLKCIGVAADHGGFELKAQLVHSLKAEGYEVEDYGAHELVAGDDYPDFVVPLARAVASGEVNRGLAICGSGVGACVAVNKVPGIRAALITDSFSAHQGVEDDNMNIMCLGGRITGYALAWDLVQIFLNANFKENERFRRRLAKVVALERKMRGNSKSLDYRNLNQMKMNKMKKVLIALDYNPTAQKVAETGFSLAKSLNAEVILLHVMTDPVFYATSGFSPIMGFDGYVDVSPTVLDSIDGLKEASLQFLDKSRKHLGDKTIQTMVKEGEFAETILETAKEVHANIIVLGSHSQKWLENIVMGSVTEKVLHHTSIPLFIVPTRKNT